MVTEVRMFCPALTMTIFWASVLLTCTVEEELNIAKTWAKWLICREDNDVLTRKRPRDLKKTESWKEECSETGPCRWTGEEKGLKALSKGSQGGDGQNRVSRGIATQWLKTNQHMSKVERSALAEGIHCTWLIFFPSHERTCIFNFCCYAMHKSYVMKLLPHAANRHGCILYRDEIGVIRTVSEMTWDKGVI